MKKIIIYLIFLISFANAMQCYNGKTYVDIPESKLSEIGYTEYNITHSSFDCKVAYNRYLKVKEIEPVNVSYITKNEKNEIEEPSKIGSFLPICLLVLIVFILWLIKNIIKEEPQDELYSDIQKERIKPKNNSIKTEYIKTWNDLSEYYENLEKIEQEKPKKESVKSWDDLPREYSENLRKIEEERVKNGFYEIPKSKPAYTIIKNKPFNNSLDKTKTAYELLLERPEWKAYRLAVLAERGEKCEWCGSDKNLHLHHKFYLKYPNGKHILPWQYKTDALLVLCKDCHTKAHKNYKIKSYYVSY